MDMHAGVGRLRTELIEQAEALAPKIEAAATRIEAERRIVPEVLQAMHQARLFRMLLPRSIDGEEVDPETFFRVIERVAMADSSTAWCLCQGNGCAMSGAYLAPEVAREIFEPADSVLAWGPGPKVKAVADGPDGYRVTGAWSFASGGRHATWLGADCPLFAADGSPIRDSNGQQLMRVFLVPAGEVRWTDIWNVIGLRGTASDQFALEDHYVRTDHSITRDYTRERRESGPLYRMSAMFLYAIGFSGVALGTARTMLDTFMTFARDKYPRGVKSPIRDNNVVQLGTGQSEAKLQSARALLLQSVREIWADVQRSGTFTVPQRMQLRMATTYAIQQAREVSHFVYHAAGATAIFADNPYERRFRDLNTVTQQVQGRLAHLENVGFYLMGGEPDLTFA
ncbi:MAG: acyl-CoA dehydrogenase family protein [Reyranellaceae bacterium]